VNVDPQPGTSTAPAGLGAAVARPSTASSASVSSPRCHALDGLRAVAAVIVLVHHLATAALAEKLIRAGHHFWGSLLSNFTASGVELFFVLSAVVLVRPYVRGLRPMDAMAYARRRMQRLFPPYLVAWLLTGLAVYLVGRYPTWWTGSAGLPPFHWLDWWAQAGILYFGTPYNFAWWSLTIEVMFYVAVPLLVPLVIWVLKTNTGRGMAGLFALSLAISVMFYAMPEPAAAWLRPVRTLFTYASCFCAGICLAHRNLPRPLTFMVLGLGLAWVVLAVPFPVLNLHAGWGLIHMGVAAWALDERTQLSRWLSSWFLVWLGERSYSLFVVHYAVIVMVCHAVSLMLPVPGALYLVLTRGLSLGLSLLAAMLVFHGVERHFARNLATADAFWPVRQRRG
jgi:peptidoglycan/LPS O-acetylase OafA/YrhL